MRVVCLLAMLGCTSGETLRIEIERPAWVAVQDGDGPWLPYAQRAAGRVETQITSGHYGVAWLCDGPARFTCIQLSTDIDDVTIACPSSVDDPHLLRGATDPGATIFGWTDAHGARTGAYSLALQPGPNDVFAVLPGSPARIVVERDIDGATDQVLDLAVEQTGAVMPVVTPVVVAAKGPVALYSDIHTANGSYGVLGRDALAVPVPPADLVLASDWIGIGASSGPCAAQQRFDAEPPTLEIPSAFAAQPRVGSVTWQADPAFAWEHASAWFDGAAAADPYIAASLVVRASPSWIAAALAANILPIPDIASLPGWPTDAQFGATFPVTWSFYLERGDRRGDWQGCHEGGTLRR